MKRFVLLALLGVAAFAGCGPSQQQACNDYAVAFCSRNLACLTGGDLTTFQNAYGSTQDVCVANYEGGNCRAIQSPCPPGLNYDTGREEQCVTDYQNASCQDIVQPGFQPDSCSISTVCH